MFTRREMLQRVGTGIGVLGLAGLLQDEKLLGQAPTNPLAPRVPHHRARAKRIIHLFMNGGPSQVDTFDPKPKLRDYVGQRPAELNLPTDRGTFGLMPTHFRFRQHGQSGLPVSEIFPHVAECADDLCVLRSLHTDVPNHQPAQFMMTCGNNQPIRPSVGAWLVYGLGSENANLPGFVALYPGMSGIGNSMWSNSFLPGIYQGTHVNTTNLDPSRVLDNLTNGYLGASAQRRQLDMIRQLNRMHLEQRAGDNPLETRIQSMEMAFRMQFEALEAFDVRRETEATRRLYGEGRFNDGCLLARRLVERGVRVVQVFCTGGQWDDHRDMENHRNNARQVDQPIAALLKDLKSRGMLEDTLVLWGGEFGRTPTSEGAAGRDHNSRGFTVWLAGGGVKGGMAYGATDDFGFAAAVNPMHVHDLHATILYLMGLDHERLTYRYSGRDFRLTDVSGTVHDGIFA